MQREHWEHRTAYAVSGDVYITLASLQAHSASNRMPNVASSGRPDVNTVPPEARTRPFVLNSRVAGVKRHTHRYWARHLGPSRKSGVSTADRPESLHRCQCPDVDACRPRCVAPAPGDCAKLTSTLQATDFVSDISPGCQLCPHVNGHLEVPMGGQRTSPLMVRVECGAAALGRCCRARPISIWLSRTAWTGPCISVAVDHAAVPLAIEGLPLCDDRCRRPRAPAAPMRMVRSSPFWRPVR
jgi:hypothetical protein